MPQTWTEISAADASGIPPSDAISNIDTLRFGTFEVLPGARSLLSSGLPVEIGGRAFDLLMALLERAGEIVSKDMIMRRVWPTTTVDESNLRFQMTCLRKILGAEGRRIKTVPGRGYIFIAADERALEAARVPVSETAARPPIVIIDGDTESREHLRRILASAGARVESFATIRAFLAESAIATGSRALPRMPAIAA